MGKSTSTGKSSNKALTFTRTGIAAALRRTQDGGEVWITDPQKLRGRGRLRLRATKAGATFHFRYMTGGGERVHLPIGHYDEKGVDGLTLHQAGEKAGELSRLYQSGVRDLREYLAQQEAEDKARREAAATARIEAQRQETAGTLQKLMDGYIAHLTRQKKQSAQDARNLFKRNVTDEFPELASKRAADVTLRDVSAVLAKLIDRGAGRTAAKLRSYLRAAYGEALAADGEPTAHPDLHGFNLTANPAAQVPSKKLSAFNRARKRVLNETELRGFLNALDEQSGTARDAVLLSLYLGGQRAAQVVRITPGDVDIEAGTVTLFDPKGARLTPRVHVLPLTERAAAIVKRLLEVNGKKQYLISTHGKVPMRTETLSEIVTTIAATMVANKTARDPFEHRDLRRTCETMLAKMSISRDTRAQILSHGLGGVQARHYDQHDYANEKRAALEKWDAELRRILSGKSTDNVVPIVAGKQKKGTR